MPLKIAHVVNYAPGLSGMYNSVKDLVLEERRRGVRAEVIDDVASPIAHGTDGIFPVPTSFGDESDIICWHHAMSDDWLNEPHRNIVLFLHGTPEFNFFTELYQEDRVLSLLIGAANAGIPKAFVTMWKRHIPYWENLLRSKVHYIPAWVDLDSWKVSELAPNPDILRVGMVDFWRISREPFGVLAALDYLRKNTKKKLEINVWGLTEFPNDTYKAIIQWMVEDDVMILRGNTKNPMEDIYHKNDLIVTMSTEETRVVRESLACGVPVVCGRGPFHFTKYATDGIDAVALADVINRCHKDILRNKKRVSAGCRQYAEDNFDVRKAGEKVLEVFSSVVETHGSVNFPKKIDGIRMVAGVKDTAEKIRDRLLAGKPTCYVRFGDGDLILIAGAAGEKFHKNSPELQKELTEAFLHKEDGYLVSSVAGQINEGRMKKGLFARFEYDDTLRSIVNQLRPNETLDNAIALAYLSVFEPAWFVDFIKRCIHGKKVLFIGGDSLCSASLIKKVFDVSSFIEFPMADAYYSLDKRMANIEEEAKNHDLIICAAGMATRVIAKRLWKAGIKKSFIDIGSVADGIAGITDTRTWLRLVGPEYRANFETAFSPAKADIIVLTHKNEEKTIKCFDSIRKNTANYRVIWVDNGSGDDSVGKVRESASQLLECELIRVPSNEGFSKGVNRALRKSIFDKVSDYVITLNNDVVVTPGWLDNLVAAQSSGNFDAIGPLTSESNPHSLDALRGVVEDLPKFTDEDTDTRAKILREKYGTQAMVASNMLSFFCCLMRLETIEQVGLLDENIFAYGEDNDFFERMRRLGKKFGISLGSYVHHDHGSTSSMMGDGWREGIRKKSLSYLQKKWSQPFVDTQKPSVTKEVQNGRIDKVTYDKLHLGCGDLHFDGFVNVDARKTPAADIVRDCIDLSFFPAKSFSLIFANAFFEHLRKDKHKLFLDTAKLVLKDDGTIFILAIPDFETVVRSYFEKKELYPGRPMDATYLHGYTHGPLKHDLDDETKLFAWMHKAPIDKAYLSSVLNDAGLHWKIFNYCYPNELIDLNMGFIASPSPIKQESLDSLIEQFNQIIDVETVRIWQP